MKLKHLIALSALAAVTHGAVAHTHTTSYPLKPVLDAQSTDGKVAFYFGDAAHPAVTASHGDKTESARIARKLDGETASCNAALTQALDALRTDAIDHGANAVINIETSFHETHTSSATEFTCATSGSAAALKVHGELVTLGAQ
ncbi:hypothetical protein [Trinickia acidisoli]|uniref:hypothetical protein n=1 Tax=Trinickia acidisoli TaxID=2767482 RepID=UPI001A8D2956|nr:hypothetical protein [Trinickia acidisoli]